MNDNESNISEAALQYDSLRFDNKHISGPEANNDQQKNTELLIVTVVYQTVEKQFLR